MTRGGGNGGIGGIGRTAFAAYFALAAAACAVLCAAAVWMGGLNQDEGWYLYAAKLVAEGMKPYRDFAYTQAPAMPFAYAAFAWAWAPGGLLSARVFTLIVGMVGVAFACGTARQLSAPGRRDVAGLTTFFLLATNLYHLYYLAIPKTYALASLFVMSGFYLLALGRGAAAPAFASGALLALAAGTRISLGAILPVVAVALLAMRRRAAFLAFAAGSAAALALVFWPFVADPAARQGLIAAQAYHAARGGSDPVWAVGSLSRLVRWYLPVFIVLGLGGFRRAWTLAAAFLAVFAVQMLAPFPYEDYQVPVMGLLAAFAAVNFAGRDVSGENGESDSRRLLLVLGLSFATSFGSPLLEKWTTDGQDRFWPIKKSQTELSQLRDAARTIEALDPGGKTLLTQDLYLAVETGRHVPKGLEMGPFSILSDDEWRRLLVSAECPVAALSGYTFAIDPPSCRQRASGLQGDYWRLLSRGYRLAVREEAFGQNATPLLIFTRKDR